VKNHPCSHKDSTKDKPEELQQCPQCNEFTRLSWRPLCYTCDRTITIREINRLMIKQNHDKIRENLSEALLLVVNCIPLLDGEKIIYQRSFNTKFEIVHII